MSRFRTFTAAVATLTGAAVVGIASPSAALDCEARPPSVLIADAPLAFVGEQTAESGSGKQTYRVDTWITGGEDETELTMQRDEDWGQSYVDAGVKVFLGRRTDDGDVRASLCGNALDPLHAEVFLNGTLQPRAGGTAAFVTATRSLDGITAALLNEEGGVLQYAAGERQIMDLARCPGDDVIAAIAADDLYLYDETGPLSTWFIELRRTSDLSLVADWPIEDATPGRRGGQGVIDLRCHAADGSTLTAITPRWRHNDLNRNEVAEAGDVIVIRDGGIEALPVEWPREATYDPATSTVHVIADEGGREIVSIDDAGDRTVRTLPGTHIGWHLEVTGEQWEIFTESADPGLDPQMWTLTHILTGPFDDLEERVLPFASQSGSLVDIHPTPDGRILHLADGTAKALVLDVTDFSFWTYYDVQWFQPIAPRGDALLVGQTDAPSGLSLVAPDGETRAITGLIGGDPVVSIWPSEPTVYAEPEPVPGFTAASVEATSESALPTGNTGNGEPGDDQTSWALILLAAAVAGGALVFWRRQVTSG